MRSAHIKGMILTAVAGITFRTVDLAPSNVDEGLSPRSAWSVRLFTCILCIFITASIIALCFVGFFVPITIEFTTIDIVALLYLSFVNNPRLIANSQSEAFLKDHAKRFQLVDPDVKFLHQPR